MSASCGSGAEARPHATAAPQVRTPDDCRCTRRVARVTCGAAGGPFPPEEITYMHAVCYGNSGVDGSNDGHVLLESPEQRNK